MPQEKYQSATKSGRRALPPPRQCHWRLLQFLINTHSHLLVSRKNYQNVQKKVGTPLSPRRKTTFSDVNRTCLVSTAALALISSNNFVSFTVAFASVKKNLPTITKQGHFPSLAMAHNGAMAITLSHSHSIMSREKRKELRGLFQHLLAFSLTLLHLVFQRC